MTAPRVYHYRIDFEGRIFHDGSEITDAISIRQLISRVRHDGEGRPYALCMGEHMMLEPVDVIHVIRDFEDPDRVADPTRALVRCQAGVKRRVDLTALVLRDLTYLYAPIDEGGFARFGRRAAMRFAERWLRPGGEGFELVIGERRYPVREVEEVPRGAPAESVAPPEARR